MLSPPPAPCTLTIQCESRGVSSATYGAYVEAAAGWHYLKEIMRMNDYEGFTYTTQEESRYYAEIPPPWRCDSCGRFFGANKPHDCPKAGLPTVEEANALLIDSGYNPEEVGRRGAEFAHTQIAKVAVE